MLLALTAAVVSPASVFAATVIPSLPEADRPVNLLKTGEYIYRKGLLPSGEPLAAIVKGDVHVEGTMFSCVSCHLRSGLGSVEGRIVSPPVNGAALFNPRKAFYKGFEVSRDYVLRPAYNDASLAEAIWRGEDSAGRPLHEIMPRYMLSSQEMHALIAYLKSLSAGSVPGVTDKVLRFATVISEDADPEKRRVMLALMDSYISGKNAQAKTITVRGGRTRMMAEAMLESKELAYRNLALSRWIVNGPPQTWAGQLEDYYRQEPVFAILGGMIEGSWKPVHDFAEEHKIPTLFPVTDFPVIAEGDWYTLYLSKGYIQEGEAAALYLNRVADSSSGDGEVVQIYRDTEEGKALASGFEKVWHDAGRKPPHNVILKPGEKFSAGFLQDILGDKKAASVMLWLSSSEIGPLREFVSTGKFPERIFVSWGYSGDTLLSVKDGLRDMLYITYPKRLPVDEMKYRSYLTPYMGVIKAGPGEMQVLNHTYLLLQVLTQALMDMKGSYYPDYFLDVIGMMPDQDLPLYERLSFGPGQRFASKGCYIVQLTKGENPGFIRRSDWVVH